MWHGRPMAKKILLDCDPGLDDALALLLAHGDPNLELVGVTTVGGNVGLPRTTANALALREYLHFEQVPIARGAGAPLPGARSISSPQFEQHGRVRTPAEPKLEQREPRGVTRPRWDTCRHGGAARVRSHRRGWRPSNRGRA